MKQGTVSVLVGCHSPVHSLVVLVAWLKLYRSWPAPWQIVCIFLHDIGHWGKDYLDDYELKKRHAQLGAKVCGKLFGRKGFDLVAGHNPYAGQLKSSLHDPDKYSWVIAPLWWMATNCFFEPKLTRPGYTRRQSARMFKVAMTESQRTGFKTLGHDIYLQQWRGESR